LVGGIEGAADITGNACRSETARQGIAQRSRERLGGLRHHAVAFEFGIGALIQNQIKGKGGVFQFTQGDVVCAQVCQRSLRQLRTPGRR